LEDSITFVKDMLGVIVIQLIGLGYCILKVWRFNNL